MENTNVNWEDTPEELDAFNRTNFSDIKKMEVTVGDHKIALMGNPFFYKMHWIESRKRSVICPGEGCPLCSSGDFYRGKYAANIYNYKDGAVEILEFGRMIKNQLSETVKLWGNNLESFDIVLKRVGKKKEDTKYTVVAIPRTVKLSKELTPYDLVAIYKPTPIDKIIEILDGKDSKGSQEQKAVEEDGLEKNGESGNTASPDNKSSDTAKTAKGEVVIEDETAEIDLDKLIESDD